MSETLAIPAIHNNGTSKEELVNDLREAYLSLRIALDKLNITAPHQRDYYVKQNNDYEKARVQYCNRHKKITEVMKELELIAIAIKSNERLQQCQ